MGATAGKRKRAVATDCKHRERGPREITHFAITPFKTSTGLEGPAVPHLRSGPPERGWHIQGVPPGGGAGCWMGAERTDGRR